MSDERNELEGAGEVLEEGAQPREELVEETTATAESEAEAQQDLVDTEAVTQQEETASSTDAEPEAEPEAAATTPSEPVVTNAPATQEAGSHVDYSDTFKSLTEGEVVDGIVVHIDKEGVLVDVGTKSEGIIRPDELSALPVGSAEDVVAVGDKIGVYVVQSENADGNPVLSKKRADFEDAWERVQEAHVEGKVLTAMVTDRVKGGLVVDLGIRGFVPGSHIGTGRTRNLERYVGQSLPFKVIEVDRERRKVVLSHRLAVEEERSKQREQTVKNLAEGQVRQGVVRRITDYGAFVDLGGIDGLLHVSEMSWTRVNHPSDVVRVGQKIQVMLLKLNLEAGRVSLGLRQILPDPWSEVPEKYSVGQVINGSVSRIVPFGAFVQLGEGIEGIIPNAELSHRRVKKPEDVVAVGDSVEAKVLDIRPEERRMTLSIRQMQEDKDVREYDDYRSSSRSNGNMTLGELVGDKLSGLITAEPEEQIAEETAQEEPEKVPEVEAAQPETEIEAVTAEIETSEEPAAEAVEETAETETAEEPVAEAVEETAETETAEEPVVEAVEETAEVKTVEEEEEKAAEAESETTETPPQPEAEETLVEETEAAPSVEEEDAEEESTEEETDKSAS